MELQGIFGIIVFIFAYIGVIVTIGMPISSLIGWLIDRDFDQQMKQHNYPPYE